MRQPDRCVGTEITISVNVGASVAGGVVGVNAAQQIINGRWATKGENSLAAGTGFLVGVGGAIKAISSTAVVDGLGTGVSSAPSQDSPPIGNTSMCTLVHKGPGNCQ